MIIYIERKPNVSKKLKSKSPLLFGIAAEHKKHFIEVPRKALERFVNKTANMHDWEALMFRMRTCYEIALDIYVLNTQKEILFVVELLRDIFYRYQESKTFDLSEEDIKNIELGLDAMDTMQDQVTRKEMLGPFLRTRQYMKQFVSVN